MKKSWIFLLIFATGLHAHTLADNKPAAIQDSLILRRIVEYWKEGDIPSVKAQIRNFLSKQPTSAFAEQLYAMLGDIYFREKNYTDALDAYDQIKGQEFQKKCLFQKVYCLYAKGLYADVIAAAKNCLALSTLSKEQENTLRFQMANSYHRLAQLNDNKTAKEALYKEAMSLYKVLAPTHYADLTLYPLAEIHAYFHEDQQAAHLFLQLADKHPDKKEEFLFQAATFQLNFNTKQAIKTYQKTYQLGGPHAPQAAYNQIALLFEEKEYRELLLAQQEALKYISSEQMPIIHYYVGKSLFAMGDYAHAVVPLKLFAASPQADNDLLKSSLLCLVACAQQTGDVSLFDDTLSRLQEAYPEDEQRAQALILHAQLCKEKRDFARAKRDLEELLEVFPEHPQKEAVFYDYAVLLSQNQEWEAGAKAFDRFLKDYPNSLKRGASWRHLCSCQIESVKQVSPATERIKKEELICVLKGALEQSKIFSQTERQRVHFLLGQTYFETEHYDEALQCLADYIADYRKDPLAFQAHLMMAECHWKGTQDMFLFAAEMEKALALQPDLPEKSALHIRLYNAYLSLAQQATSEDKRSLVDQAADHLYSALDLPVKRENQLWLANYYYRQLQETPGKQKELSRAVAVLEQLLGINGDLYRLDISADSLDKEAEAIKLSQLYTQANRFQEKARLLQALKDIQEQHPDWDWKYQRLTLFELAKTYEELGKVQRAMQAYEFLIHSASHSASYFASAAELNLTRLQYSQIGAPKENMGAVQVILDHLKDLEIKRRLVTEPIHLEAAMSYIEIKSNLFPEENKIASTLKLIRQTRESFTALDDPLVQQYFAVKEQFRDKLQLFQQYMQFLSAEEFRLEGILALERQETFRAKELKMKALVHLDTLCQGNVHEFLQQRVRQAREALNQDL